MKLNNFSICSNSSSKSIMVFLSMLVFSFSTKAVKENEKIEHPQSVKGLIKIEKDGAFIYQTKPLETRKSAQIKMGMIPPLDLRSVYVDGTGADQEVTFSDIYTDSNLPFLTYDYEWQPFTNFGKLGVQAGFGFFYAEGNGRLKATNEVAEEKYTFLGLPINAGLIYRLQIGPRPWIAPYIAGGGNYFMVLEKRDDKSLPKAYGVFGVYGGGGLMFNIAAIDRETAHSLSSEYDIGNLWVLIDARYLKTFSDTLSVGTTVISGGIALDF